MKQARQIVTEALCKMERQEAWSNLALEGALRENGLDARDSAFASALFYGVLSRLFTLDACIRAHSKTPPQKLDAAVRAILRGAAYQLLYMTSVPEHAAVSEAVALTKRFRKASASGFVNAVLRSFLRAGKAIPLPEGPPEERLSILYSCDPALAGLLLRSYGREAAESILLDSVEPPPVFLRVNTLKTALPELQKSLEARGIETKEDASLPDCLLAEAQGALHGLPEFREGLFHIQDRSSQYCAELLGAQPGERVLDVCAAPGGKSFTLAELMRNEGELLACDLHEHRCGLIEKRAEELGITMLRVKTADMSVPQEGLGLFDRVLCDVPCSGYGAMRRRPEIKYKPPGKFSTLPDLQYKILETSANYCKDGGSLLYSTCTLNPAENEAVAEQFLAARPEFLECRRETLLPGQNGGDGFFLVLFQRRPR